MAYEVEALATGWRLGLHASDWRNLMALAHRYGWEPTAGLDRYLHEGKQVVAAHEARVLAAEAMRFRPESDSKNYFAWQRRWIVEEVIRLCERGALEVQPM